MTINPTKTLDEISKEIFSYNRILTYILKASILEYHDVSVEEISYLIHSNNPHFDPDDANSKVISLQTVELSGKTIFDSYYAVSLPDGNGEIDVYVDIEAQSTMDSKQKVEARQNVYLSRMINDQKDAIDRMDYEKIKKVVSVWIYINPYEYQKGLILIEPRIKLRYNEGVIEKYNDELNTSMMVVSIYLGKDSDVCIDILNKIYAKENVEENINELKEKYGIELKREVRQMCSLQEYAINQGKKLGIQEGIKEGIKEGIESTMIENLKNLMSTANVGLMEAMNLLKLTDSDKEKYIKMMR